MNSLAMLLGPTGVGRTKLGLQVAERFGSPIIFSDFRQLYKDPPIGTAALTPEQMARVKHYMVDTLSLADYYSASNFEEDVVSLLSKLHKTIPTVIMTGDPMVYIDTVCRDVNDIPTVTPEVRDALHMQFETGELAPILAELKGADPVHYEEVDRSSCKRIIHAVRICRMTGKPYSSFHTNIGKEYPSRIIRVGLNGNRDELCGRINQRADQVVSGGLLKGARRAYPFRHLNPLNTVDYKELFNYFSGEWTLDPTVKKIKRNSRVYAWEQMTQFKRDPEVAQFHPDETGAIFTHLNQQIIWHFNDIHYKVLTAGIINVLEQAL